MTKIPHQAPGKKKL